MIAIHPYSATSQISPTHRFPTVPVSTARTTLAIQTKKRKPAVKAFFLLGNHDHVTTAQAKRFDMGQACDRSRRASLVPSAPAMHFRVRGQRTLATRVRAEVWIDVK